MIISRNSAACLQASFQDISGHTGEFGRFWSALNRTEDGCQFFCSLFLALDSQSRQRNDEKDDVVTNIIVDVMLHTRHRQIL